MSDFVSEFQNAMTAAGIICTEPLIADGLLHRFQVEGDRPGKRNGWYVLYPDAIPAGAFGCWKRDIVKTWCSRDARSLSDQDKAALKKRMEEAHAHRQQVQQANYQKAAERAQQLWEQSPPAHDHHPYLQRKKVKSQGMLHQYKNTLIIPLHDKEGKLHSLQFISAQGDKQFLTDGKTQGHYFSMGTLTSPIYLCEGIATGLSIYEATQCYTVTAFYANNLLAVAQAIHQKYPQSSLILCADNDAWTKENPGLRKATDAAIAVGAKVVIPDFSQIDVSTKPTDFNDLMQLGGIKAVKEQLKCQPLKEPSAAMMKDDDIKEDVIIQELSTLSAIDYDRQREAYAQKLGIRITTLDDAVKAKREKNKNSDQSIIFSAIEPWHEPVDGSALLFLLTKKLKQFVILSEHEAHAIALWILFTYCIDGVSVAPILNLSSPEKRCGKSTLMSLLQLLVNRPLLASNVSSAALFRTIEALNPTLLLDETDTFIQDEKSELRGILNSGHTRASAYVIRTVGDHHEPRVFSTWCAKCLAGIGHLPDTIKDRSIVIQLRRKLPHETTDNLRHADKTLFVAIQRQCVRFAADNLAIIKNRRPDMPGSLNDRAADNWEPLVAIADCVRGEWPDLARQAALAFSRTEEAMSLSVELLQDIKTIFDQKKINRLSTADLLTALCIDPEAPWATYNRGKPMVARQLSKKLKDFGIVSKNYRFGQEILKGYDVESLSDTWVRYIPSPDPLKFAATSATPLQPRQDGACSDILSATLSATASVASATSKTNETFCSGVAACSGYETAMLRIENALQPAPSADCSGVADKTPILKGEEPYPQRVSCHHCVNFKPDTIGDGSGIGDCAIKTWRAGEPVFYPHSKRTCLQYQGTEGKPSVQNATRLSNSG